MILWLCLLASAGAWETDQLTRREEPLADLTALADAEMDRLIAQAVAATNARTRCEVPVSEAHDLLVKELHDRVGPPARPADRGWPRNQGYNVFGAWLEVQDGPRRFDDRSDLFGSLKLLEAPVLNLAGVCSTVGLAGQQVGVDKVDHFLGMGFYYWRRSREGEDIERALTFGTRTERSIFGMWTSLAFSFADLEANLDGYRFYAALTSPGSEVELGPDGCLVQARGFHWADWIDWRYDEVLNPSVYTKVARSAVQTYLDGDPTQVCDSWQRWAEQDYPEHLARILAEPSPAVAGRAPPRTDPFELERRCEEATVAQTR